MLGEKVECADCKRRVVIKPGTRARLRPVFLTGTKK